MTTTCQLGHDPVRLTRFEVVLLVLVVIGCRLTAIAAFPIYDDAFITYRYAAHLAQGLGMVFNPGASWEPVLGTTTPGYAAMLGGLAALGANVLNASVMVNMLCDALSAVLLIRLLSFRRVSATVCVVCFACIPEIARISVGGMEAPVFVALALTATAFFAAGRSVPAGLAAAVCCTVRPEAVLLVGILAALSLRRPRRFALLMAPVVVVGVLAMGALWSVYGSPVSQSVQAKVALHAGGSLRRTMGILADSFGPSLPMRLVLALVVMGIWRSVVRRGPLWPFLAFAGAIVVSYLLAQPKTWGWYYYLPLTAWCAWLGIGTDELVEWVGLERMGFRSAQKLRWVPIGLALVALGGVAGYAHLYPDEVTPMVYERLEDWAREARLEERQATVLASDIGAIGYYGRTRVLDSQGLVWPDALDYPSRIEVIRAQMPDYVILVAARQRVEAFINDPVLGSTYRPIRRFNVRNENPIDGLAPSVDGLPFSWRQDYIVYERAELVVHGGDEGLLLRAPPHQQHTAVVDHHIE